MTLSRLCSPSFVISLRQSAIPLFYHTLDMDKDICVGALFTRAIGYILHFIYCTLWYRVIISSIISHSSPARQCTHAQNITCQYRWKAIERTATYLPALLLSLASSPFTFDYFAGNGQSRSLLLIYAPLRWLLLSYLGVPSYFADYAKSEYAGIASQYLYNAITADYLRIFQRLHVSGIRAADNSHFLFIIRRIYLSHRIRHSPLQCAP